MYSDGTPDVVTRDMTKMCSYAAWASQEIICDRNYMEVGPLLIIIQRPLSVFELATFY